MESFTAEETYLINFYESSDRVQLIDDIKSSLPYVIYPDEKKLMRAAIDKLEHITDEEYAGMRLSTPNKFYEQEA